MRIWNILVVDDEIFNLEIISEYLDHSHFNLVTAENGQAAWDQLEQEQSFDLILLDRMMPIMTGMEFLHKVKTDPRFRTIPVVMQTAAAAQEQVQEGLNAVIII